MHLSHNEHKTTILIKHLYQEILKTYKPKNYFYYTYFDYRAPIKVKNLKLIAYATKNSISLENYKEQYPKLTQIRSISIADYNQNYGSSHKIFGYSSSSFNCLLALVTHQCS